ncbi:MAG: GatB/YqeY domain-containing protein [Mariprofundaceae bacterium]
MALIDRITEDMKQVMKSGDKATLSAIRMLRAAIKDREIELGHPLEDADVIAVAARLVKQRKDAARQYEEAGRVDLRDRELADADVFRRYMPEPMSDAEIEAAIEAAVAETGATGMRDMGRVMAALKARLAGRADMGEVSARVRARLAD